jgi:hypothetical protein
MIHALTIAAHQARIRYGKRKTPFLGEVSAADFISGNALASAIGLTQGTAQHSDAGWLKFKDPVDGRIKFVAKRPLRRGLSWNAIDARGAAKGTRTVTINGQTYRVRLLKALGSLSTSGKTGYDHPDTHGSEWNRLMYHISGKPFANINNTLASEGIDEGDWASYSETDLAMRNTTSGSGGANWAYEPAHFRGHVGVSYLGTGPADNTHVNYGWRPVLELIE